MQVAMLRPAAQPGQAGQYPQKTHCGHLQGWLSTDSQGKHDAVSFLQLQCTLIIIVRFVAQPGPSANPPSPSPLFTTKLTAKLRPNSGTGTYRTQTCQIRLLFFSCPYIFC